jgi:hypothetical protein
LLHVNTRKDFEVISSFCTRANEKSSLLFISTNCKNMAFLSPLPSTHPISSNSSNSSMPTTSRKAPPIFTLLHQTHPLWRHPAPVWRRVLAHYRAILTERAQVVNKNASGAQLLALDEWLWCELVPALRAHRYMTRDELCSLIEWRTLRAIVRRTGSQHLHRNSPEHVQSVSQRAFALIDQNHVADALTTISTLHGVGWANASLVLSVYCPARMAFVSDELLRLFEQPTQYCCQTVIRVVTFLRLKCSAMQRSALMSQTTTTTTTATASQQSHDLTHSPAGDVLNLSQQQTQAYDEYLFLTSGSQGQQATDGSSNDDMNAQPLTIGEMERALWCVSTAAHISYDLSVAYPPPEPPAKVDQRQQQDEGTEQQQQQDEAEQQQQDEAEQQQQQQDEEPPTSSSSSSPESSPLTSSPALTPPRAGAFGAGAFDDSSDDEFLASSLHSHRPEATPLHSQVGVKRVNMYLIPSTGLPVKRPRR